MPLESDVPAYEEQEVPSKGRERIDVQLDAGAERLELANSIRNANVRTAEDALRHADALLRSPVQLSDLPPSLQQKMKPLFDRLSKHGGELPEKLSRARTPEDRERLVGAYYAEVQQVVAEARILAANPVVLRNSPLAVGEMQRVLVGYENLFPRGMFAVPQKGPAPYVKDQLSQLGRLAVVIVGSLYTAYALYAGWKSKNMLPALAGAFVTALAIWGPRRLFGGAGERVLYDMKFLEDPEYDQFLSRYHICGKKWGAYIRKLQENKTSIEKVRRVVKAKRRTNESEEEFARRKDDALHDLLMLTDDPQIQGAVRTMLTSGSESDIAKLLTLGDGSRSTDAKNDIVKYVENGGSSTCMRIARNPRIAGEVMPGESTPPTPVEEADAPPDEIETPTP